MKVLGKHLFSALQLLKPSFRDSSYCLQEGRERPGSRSLVWHDSFWLSILFCAGRASQERQML